MRMFSKSAWAKKLTDGERYSCSATLPRWSFSVIIVFPLLIFEGWKLGSFDTHYMQGSGIFSRFSYNSFLPWKKHFLKSECDVAVFWCPDTSPTTWFEKTEERAAKSVWDVLRYRIHKKQLLIFSETWSPSFCIVCNCFDDFRTNLPKNIGQFHRKQNTKFPKWRWVRSKNVCFSSALLFSLVLTKKYVLRTSWGLSFWNNTCFLFKCRVTFRLRQFSKVRFGVFAVYFLRLRCLGISNTYKNSFCFLSKPETFQNDVQYVPKMTFWALVGLLLWL